MKTVICLKTGSANSIVRGSCIRTEVSCEDHAFCNVPFIVYICYNNSQP